MKVIIAGSRWVDDPAAIAEAVEASGFPVSRVISGGARGVDELGEEWARDRGIPCTVVEADWRLGHAAGPVRNRRMAQVAEALVAVWDGESHGTGSMISEARRAGLQVFIRRVQPRIPSPQLALAL